MTTYTASSVRTKRIAIVALVAGAVGATAAFAQEAVKTQEGEIPSVTVRYSPGELSTDAGSRALYHRLVLAAEQVCPEKSGTLMALRQNVEARRCVDEAVERAVKDVKNPRFAEAAAGYMR